MVVPSAQIALDAVAVLRRLPTVDVLDVNDVPDTCDLRADRISDVVSTLVRWGLAMVEEGQMTRADRPDIVTVDHRESVRRVDELRAGARYGLTAVYADEPPSPEDLHASLPRDLDTLNRGVRMRLTFPNRYLDLPHVVEYADALGRHGAAVGYVAQAVQPFVVVDDEHAVIPLVGCPTESRALMVSDGRLGQALGQLRRRIDAIALCEHDARVARSQRPLSPSQHRILELMYAGLTDLAAARRLGVTDRTFRRHVGKRDAAFMAR